MTQKENELELILKHQFENGINLKSRTIQLVGEIDYQKFELVDAALTELDRYNNKQITVRINSEGGSVYDALAIIGRLRNSKSRIITEGYGCIMSAATLILASGDKRKVAKEAWFMHHESAYGFDGKYSEHAHYLAQKEREEEQWSNLMSELTFKDKNFWRRAGTLDSYFTAEELKEYGVVDEIF